MLLISNSPVLSNAHYSLFITGSLLSLKIVGTEILTLVFITSFRNTRKNSSFVLGPEHHKAQIHLDEAFLPSSYSVNTLLKIKRKMFSEHHCFSSLDLLNPDILNLDN